MDGILSGLFTQSKKDRQDGGNTRSASDRGSQQQSPTSFKTTPTNDGDVTQESRTKLQNDRSQDMRLSKSTPTNKTDDDFDIPADPVVPSFSQSPSPIGSSSTNQQSSNSQLPSAVIGAKITFKGELTGEEDLLIQGRVDGTIDLKGNHLTIGEQGIVNANLMAKTITINGTVEGDVIGQERIEIKSSSNVKGNLVAARVTLEDGAKFRGSIDMETATSNSSSAKTTPAAPSSSSSSAFKDSSKESTTAKDSSEKI